MRDARIFARYFSPFRYWIAERIDKLPDMCWTSLVEWASVNADEPWSWRMRDFKVNQMCRDDAKANGSCYCSRVKDSAHD